MESLEEGLDWKSYILSNNNRKSLGNIQNWEIAI